MHCATKAMDVTCNLCMQFDNNTEIKLTIHIIFTSKTVPSTIKTYGPLKVPFLLFRIERNRVISIAVEYIFDKHFPSKRLDTNSTQNSINMYKFPIKSKNYLP